MRMNTNAIIPNKVVNLPNDLDCVQPETDIKLSIAINPIKNARIPTILGWLKSAYFTLIGNPGVVIIKIFVMEKMVIKNPNVATVANRKIYVINTLLLWLRIKAMIADNENPTNRVLINVN
ncbi:MAG: hypothetical protein AAF694_25580 [Bacteroidota bacterium]